MNDYFESPQDYPGYDLLGKQQRTLRIIMLTICVLSQRKITKRSQRRGKVQGLESRGSQGQALGVLEKLLSPVRLCDAMDCSLPGSSTHGIFQARVLKWVAISSSRTSSRPMIETRSPTLQADTLASEPPGKP